MEDYYQINREAWNLRSKVHQQSEFYDVEGFKAGKTSLQEIELQEMGDVKGKSMIHLQCHFGLDSLSWARMGAKVTGVDIADESIKTAQALAKELNIDARFVRSNLYDVPKVINTQYDIVFVSYGALIWLADINKWAEIVSGLLKPGGKLYLVEFHPFIFTLDDDCLIKESYFNNEGPKDTTSEVTYADDGDDETVSYRNIEWNHSLGEIVSALLNNGLKLASLKEFPFQVYDCFPNMQEDEPGRFVFKNLGRKIPYMFSLTAVK